MGKRRLWILWSRFGSRSRQTDSFDKPEACSKRKPAGRFHPAGFETIRSYASLGDSNFSTKDLHSDQSKPEQRDRGAAIRHTVRIGTPGEAEDAVRTGRLRRKTPSARRRIEAVSCNRARPRDEEEVCALQHDRGTRQIVGESTDTPQTESRG